MRNGRTVSRSCCTNRNVDARKVRPSARVTAPAASLRRAREAPARPPGLASPLVMRFDPEHDKDMRGKPFGAARSTVVRSLGRLLFKIVATIWLTKLSRVLPVRQR